MTNTRRLARELALKVLFQVDVGKQPLSEVLDGALDQVRATVNNPMSQVVQEAQAVLRQNAAQRAQDLSPQSARQIKQAGTHCITELRGLQERAVTQTRAIVAEVPCSDVEMTVARVHAALEETQAGLRRIAGRDSSYPETLANLVDIAARRALNIEAAFVKHIPAAAQIAQFVVQLVHGAMEKHNDIDDLLGTLSTGWRLERQAAVDRNIMRLAAFEILYVPDIPTGASINEAVELAKKYSTAESGRFVNGVLGALAGQKADG